MSADIVTNWVRVVVEIDGEEKLLGSELWMNERGEDPADYAQLVLAAWDKARDSAERTLRLYGAEGVIRAASVGLVGENNQ